MSNALTSFLSMQLKLSPIRLIIPLLCPSLLAQEKPPVTEEPAPAPQTQPGQPPQQPKPGKITKISETKYRIGKVEFDQVSRAITFGATINMNKGLLEYALIHQTGKTHEALLATEISPFNLNLALIILKHPAAKNYFIPEPESPDQPASPDKKVTPYDQRNEFDIKVSWKNSDGAAKTIRIEEWIHNSATNKSAVSSPFIYTGSMVDPNGIFSAQAEGSIVALRSDPAALFNNPREGNYSDEIWHAGSNIPPVKTKVQVTFHPKKTEGKAADKK